MADYKEITPEELEKNYSLKAIKKIVTREFPWVKDITFEKDKVNKYSIIFLDLIIDPWELAEDMGWRVNWFVNRRFKTENEFWSPYLSIYFKDKGYHDTEPIIESMKKIFKSVLNSPALPPEFKLPKGRTYDVGTIIASPTSKPIESSTEKTPPFSV